MENEKQQSEGQTKKCPKCGEEIQASAKKCKHCQSDLRNWFVRHKIMTGILALIGIVILMGAIGSGPREEKAVEKKKAEEKQAETSQKQEVTQTSSKNEEEEKNSPVVNESAVAVVEELDKKNELDKEEVEPLSIFPSKERVQEIIKKNAQEKWGDDYRMVKYEYDNQVEAYSWLIEQKNHPQIMGKAYQKWGDDYKMVKYEYDNQVEAYESL